MRGGGVGSLWKKGVSGGWADVGSVMHVTTGDSGVCVCVWV